MAWSGDRAKFDHLVREYLPDGLRFALRLTGDPHRAEEILQESLLRAARGWKGFRQDAQFKTWLYRIIVNVFRDQLARRPSPEPLPEDLADNAQREPSGTLLADELAHMIGQLVSGLPPRQREVLVLSTYEGLSVAEISAALEITEANIHATLHAARTRLRKQLAGYLAEK